MGKRILFLCTHNSWRSQMAEFRRVWDEIRVKLGEYLGGK